MIEYRAPGKAVVWGEYAVLEGAPALVMAVDRYASAQVEPGSGSWEMTATGFDSSASLSAAALMELATAETEGVAGLIRAVIAGLEDPPLPHGARIRTDSVAFHTEGIKLGIGSSAAVCTAACAAIAEFLDKPFREAQALSAHRLLQGKAGSGLDVAAACHGGLIRFQSGASTTASWPATLHYRYLWVGHAAKTSTHLARFSEWRSRGQTGTLDALCQASEQLFETPDLAHLTDYVSRLKNMDDTAGLGIFGDAHEHLHKLANRAQVVYKPCGAGGGDIGIAISDDPSQLDQFIDIAIRHSIVTLDLEIAAHGVHRFRT